jgi:hypothetical protein
MSDFSDYKVAVIAPRVVSFTGGAQRLAYLASELRKLGMRSWLVSKEFNGDPRWLSHILADPEIFYLTKDCHLEEYDAVIWGHPFLRYPKKLNRPKKFWLMQGHVPEWDDENIRNPELVNLACSTGLYEAAQRVAPRVKTYNVPGGIDLRKFFHCPPNAYSPVGFRYRSGTHKKPGRPPKRLRTQQHFVELTGLMASGTPAFYAGCSVFLCNDFASAGWCNPVAEAMAVGRPVLVNDNPAVRDLVIPAEKKVGFVYKSLDEGIIKALELRKDPDALLEMGEAARAHVEQFSWSNWARSVAEVIQTEIRG